jgi:hypothetical protein
MTAIQKLSKGKKGILFIENLQQLAKQRLREKREEE